MCCKLQDEHSLFYSKSPIDGGFRAVDKTPKSGNSSVCNTSLARLLSPRRQPPEESAPPLAEATAHEEVTPAPVGRQISPQVAAALLSKSPTELRRPQAKIVDMLKEQCPGFAVMRQLVLGFRTILRVGKLATASLDGAGVEHRHPCASSLNSVLIGQCFRISSIGVPRRYLLRYDRAALLMIAREGDGGGSAPFCRKASRPDGARIRAWACARRGSDWGAWPKTPGSRLRSAPSDGPG
jgi:hypothetical protein